jgi:hypothetical protein
MKLSNEKYLYGRVIREVDRGGTIGPFTMVYFYSVLTDSKEPIPLLSTNKLLLEPIITDHRGWQRGYYETIAFRPLRESDILPVHCFIVPKVGGYCDEYGIRPPQKYEPVGFHAHESYLRIDHFIAEKLGIPDGLKLRTKRLKRMPM